MGGKIVSQNTRKVTFAALNNSLNFSSDNSPFPSSIKPKNNVNATYSDQQKAEDKMLQYKMANFGQNHRSLSTVSGF